MANTIHRALQALVLAIRGEFAQEFYTDDLRSALVLANRALEKDGPGSMPDETELPITGWGTDD